MRHQAIKVRLYPTTEQQVILAQHFGCSRWWWNYALNLCIETYKETGKGLTYRGSPHLQDKRVISRRSRVPAMFKVGIGSGLTEERS